MIIIELKTILTDNTWDMEYFGFHTLAEVEKFLNEFDSIKNMIGAKSQKVMDMIYTCQNDVDNAERIYKDYINRVFSKC